jgi:hypothetical protein
VLLVGDIADPYPRSRGVEDDRARRDTIFRADHDGTALAGSEGSDGAVRVELEGAHGAVLCGIGPEGAWRNDGVLVPVRAVGIEGDLLDLRPVGQFSPHLRRVVSQRGSGVAGTIGEVQFDHAVVC